MVNTVKSRKSFYELFKFGAEIGIADAPQSGFPTQNTNAILRANPQSYGPRDPLLEVLAASGTNPEMPPLWDNFLVHKRALGSRGTEIYAGYAREEYLRELQGHDRAKIFDKMRRSDTQVKMLLGAVKNSIRQACWEIEPAGDGLQDQIDAAFIKHVLFEAMPPRKSFNKFLGEALTMAEYGHSVFEKTYKLVIDHPKWGTYHAIAGLDMISPKTIYRWNLDRDTGNLTSVTQIAVGDLHRYVNIPSEFLLVFSLDQEGSNYEGISLLRPCYGNWFRKNLYLQLNAIGIEKFAVPTPIVDVPPGWQGTEQYAYLLQALEVYTSGQSNYLTKPAGVAMTLEQNAYDPSKVEASIDAEDRRMAKAFLANFLELGANSKGSFALSEDLSDFFLAGLEYIAQDICDVVNDSLIPEIVNMNLGPRGKLPKLKFSGISDKAGKELAEIVQVLTTAQVVVPDDPLEEAMRKRYNLPKKSDIGIRDTKPQASMGDGSGGFGAPKGSSDGRDDKGQFDPQGAAQTLSDRIRRRIYG